MALVASLPRWCASGAFALGLAVAMWGCTVDPGQNFVIPISLFNADYFYCHVEPEYLFAPQTQCGTGQASDNMSCHFNTSIVIGMLLQNHPLIDCGGGDHPLNTAAGSGATGPSSPANNNFMSASLEMTRNCTTFSTCDAPILLRPTDVAQNHPHQIFPQTDPTFPNIIYTWANTP